MTQAREQQISLDATPFYHCYVRCVRRAYLCGEDRATGENYDHRKQWIVSRIRFLSYVYAIDICAYAIMSNHYHIVLHVNKEKAEGWSWTEVAERWMQLYKGNMLVHRWLKEPDSLSDAELGKVSTLSGDFNGTLTVDPNGLYSFSGNATINFTDTFTDPYDIFEVVPGEWNPGGTPFDITDQWTEPYSGGGICP